MRAYLIHFTGQLLEARAEAAEVRQELVVVKERVEDAEAKVAAVRPKAEFYDEFADADGLYDLHNAARAIGAPPQGFVDWLKRGLLFYQDRELMPKAAFVTLGIFQENSASSTRRPGRGPTSLRGACSSLLWLGSGTCSRPARRRIRPCSTSHPNP
nr:phage antirepressor KilAC domain-containing protein [Methylobacterium sp. Leaf94]